MFTIENRKLIRGFKEHIAAGLGGACDYVANYEDIASPIDGIVEKQYTGSEGGLWLWIKDSEDRIWQFAHLSTYNCSLNHRIAKGQIIAVSGNSGSISSGPHLHIQILDQDSVRIDPEIIIKENIMNYENKIIRNQKSGAFALVVRNKKYVFKDMDALALITFLQRSGVDQDKIVNVSDEVFAGFPISVGLNF